MYYLLLDMAPILLIALPMTLIIITGEIDLSVASVVGLSSVLVGLLHHDAGLSIPVAGLIAILVGAVAGAFNGFLVAYVGLPSLAVTIGTLALYRGLAVGLLGTKAITDYPEKWTDLAKQRIGESSYPVIVVPFVVLLIVFVLLLHFSAFGRGVFEIGLNSEAAHFTGVSVERTKFLLFVLAGAVAGVRRHLLHAALRQRPRRQRHRARAPGDRGGAARRRLDLRRPRRAARRRRRRAAHRRPVQRDAAGDHHGQRHQHRHRAAPRRLGDVHKFPGLAQPGPVGKIHRGFGPRHAPASGQHTKGTTMKHMRKRYAAFAALVLAASLALTACGSDDGGDDATDDGGDGGSSDSLSVTFLPKNLGNPYFDTSDAGGEKAVGEFGGEYSEVGPDAASPDAQVPFINTAAQQGVGALVDLGQRPDRDL